MQKIIIVLGIILCLSFIADPQSRADDNDPNGLFGSLSLDALDPAGLSTSTPLVEVTPEPPVPKASQLIQFPVTIRQRSSSSDPGIDTTPQISREQALQNPLPLTESDRLLRARQNTETFTPVRTTSAPLKKTVTGAIPIPPARPNIMNASRVAAVSAQKKTNDLFSGHKQAGLAVKAAPTKVVQAESLNVTESLPSRIVAHNQDERGTPYNVKDIAPQEMIALVQSTNDLALRLSGETPPKRETVIRDISVPIRNDNKSATNRITRTYASVGNKTQQKLGETKGDAAYLFALSYKPGIHDFPNASESTLRQSVLGPLRADPLRRIQIESYATVSSEQVESARRISLARALALRDFLIANGIASSRIDVKARGQAQTGHNSDIVYFYLVEPEKG